MFAQTNIRNWMWTFSRACYPNTTTWGKMNLPFLDLEKRKQTNKKNLWTFQLLCNLKYIWEEFRGSYFLLKKKTQGKREISRSLLRYKSSFLTFWLRCENPKNIPKKMHKIIDLGAFSSIRNTMLKLNSRTCFQTKQKKYAEMKNLSTKSVNFRPVGNHKIWATCLFVKFLSAQSILWFSFFLKPQLLKWVFGGDFIVHRRCLLILLKQLSFAWAHWLLYKTRIVFFWTCRFADLSITSCIQSKSLRNFDSLRKFSSKISRSCESFGVGCIFTISEPCRWFCWNESNPKNGKDKGNPNETVGWC